jgi:hypothetical protein
MAHRACCLPQLATNHAGIKVCQMLEHPSYRSHFSADRSDMLLNPVTLFSDRLCDENGCNSIADDKLTKSSPHDEYKMVSARAHFVFSWSALRRKFRNRLR